MGNTANTTETVTVERPTTPSGRVKKAVGVVGTDTKHVAFTRAHIHRGITYKAGDEADLLVPEADDLIKLGAVGERAASPSFKKDVTKE